MIFADTPPISTRVSWAIPGVLISIVLSASMVAFEPWLLLPILAICLISILTTLRDQAVSIFLLTLFAVIFGYMLQGRGFAYIGVPPIYIGEIALGIGIAALAVGQVNARFSRFELPVLLFMALGLLRTIPYLGTEGIMAIRDASLWYYASFAILIAVLLTEAHWRVALGWLKRFLPFLVAWFTVMPVLFQFLPSSTPTLPGSPLPILSVMKPGDRAVFLVFIAALAITGLSPVNEWKRVHSPFFWTLWISSSLLMIALSRGGMLSLLLGITVLIILKPTRDWFKPIGMGCGLLCVILVWNPTIETGGYRELSAHQLIANATSIFSESTDDLRGTQTNRAWRLEWWSDIYDDTVRGPDFLMGKGFGVNLAEEYGYMTDESGSLRSPHNIHFAILARMGAPGLLLWVFVQFSFANNMLLGFRHARKRGDQFLAGTFAVVLATTFAALINASFDVYLEGPQGAIPFWCLFGVGLAALRYESAYPSSNATGEMSQYSPA